MVPSASAAVAVIETGVFRLTVLPVTGEVMDTVGGTPRVTVTTTFDEVACTPRLSVATAVSVVEPAVVGVQATLNGEVVSVPIDVPFAKNCTLEMVALPCGVAVAVIVVRPVTMAPAAGAVMLTVGDAAGSITDTETPADVVWLPKVSVATAVRE
jgi:hypothetical protein